MATFAWFVSQLVFQDVATPLTNTHYLGAQRGAMYSAEHNLERFQAETVARNRCNTPVKNLYISGKKPFMKFCIVKPSIKTLKGLCARYNWNPASSWPHPRVSVSSRPRRVQLWYCRSSTRWNPLRLRRVGAHRLHRLALLEKEAEEEESQRAGTAGSEETAVRELSTSPEGH